jgi:hypothetical protein
MSDNIMVHGAHNNNHAYYHNEAAPSQPLSYIITSLLVIYAKKRERSRPPAITHQAKNSYDINSLQSISNNSKQLMTITSCMI